MNIKSIFVNLPSKNLQQSREFWATLGFSFNEQFSDENAICLILKEDAIYSMLISHPMFSGFANRNIAESTTTQVLLAIEVDSREKVDVIVSLALAHGATRYRESADHGWMYYDSFADPDGHQWEIMYTEPQKTEPI